jgi:biopolymer transport protein TolQ
VFAPLLVAPAASSMDLGAMIAHSGPIGIFVMFTLIVMSIACWGIIVLKYKHLRIAEQQTRKFLDCFWNAADLDKVYHQAQNLRRSPVAQLFLAGYGELRRAGNDAEGSFAAELGSFENIERALQRGAIAERTELERMTSFLATTASAAPFIGLFGTVVGIIRAFQNIGLQGSASLAVVAPGISEALVVTAAGLGAAIPAVIAYNYFLSRIRVLRSEMESFASDFLNVVKRHFFS